MTGTYKTKIAHLLDNGDKLELEVHLEADSHDAACEQAKQRLEAIIKELASAPAIDIDKTKIELTGC